MNPAPQRDDFRYHPFYCEENAWWLATGPQLAAYERWLVFVTNAGRTCPMWCQRAAREGPVVWDYHVIVIARLPDGLCVFDLDTTLGFPVALPRYLEASFPDGGRWSTSYAPLFRPIASAVAETQFASDRRHMRTAEGGWQAPPPPWAPIQGIEAPLHNLDRWLDVGATDDGPSLSLQQLPLALARRS